MQRTGFVFVGLRACVGWIVIVFFIMLLLVAPD